MPFTDDDLKRLKQRCECYPVHTNDGKQIDVNALLSRLEAAEAICNNFMQWRPEMQNVPMMKAWRKAAGRDK